MMKIYKNLKSISGFLLLTLSLFIVGCEQEINDENYLSNDFVGFSFDQNVDVPIGETIVVDVDVYASSAKDMDRTLGLYVDDSSTAPSTVFTVPSSVTIPAGAMKATVEVTITGGELGSGGKSIVIGMNTALGLDMPTSVNDEGDILQKMHTINAKDACFENTVTLDIVFDDYPEENAWQLYAGSDLYAQGGVTGGSITGYPGEETYTTTFCLSNGDYTFVVYDLYSDGMCCSYGDGSYTVTAEDGTVLASGGSFGANEVTDFTL
jgi:hypothetical protein